MADRTTQSEMANNMNQKANKEDAGLTRREVIKLAASAVVAAPLVGLSGPAVAREGKAPLFFTREEFALVDELTELIIPTDDHSPGARAAEATAYIDARLAEAFTDEPKQLWRDGLKRIDALSQEMHSQPFLKATPDQRIALLTKISQNEMNPKTPEEIFFREVKGRTVHAYYTSKIGIHTEMEYKGNSYLKEFVGYEAT